MMICRRCQDAIWSRGEKFKVITYFGYDNHKPDELIKCEWCGEEYEYRDDEVDEVIFD